MHGCIPVPMAVHVYLCVCMPIPVHVLHTWTMCMCETRALFSGFPKVQQNVPVAVGASRARDSDHPARWWGSRPFLWARGRSKQRGDKPVSSLCFSEIRAAGSGAASGQSGCPQLGAGLEQMGRVALAILGASLPFLLTVQQ